MKQNSEAGPAIDRAFLNVLTSHKGGSVISEASAALKQVTAAIQQTGKAGKVTLTMTLKPAGKASHGTMVFATDVKAVAPLAEQPASIFYANEDFNLVREDPNQTKLDLRVAGEGEQPANELRKVVEND